MLRSQTVGIAVDTCYKAGNDRLLSRWNKTVSLQCSYCMGPWAMAGPYPPAVSFRITTRESSSMHYAARHLTMVSPLTCHEAE